MPKSEIGLPKRMSRDDAYVAGAADGRKEVRRELGPAIEIIKAEMSQQWNSAEASEALIILHKFATEENDEPAT